MLLTSSIHTQTPVEVTEQNISNSKYLVVLMKTSEKKQLEVQ